MNSIPPLTDTTTNIKATKANYFLVPECVRYLQNYLDSGYVMDAPHLVARTATRSCTTEIISAVDSFYVKTVITTFMEPSMQFKLLSLVPEWRIMVLEYVVFVDCMGVGA